MSTDHQQIIASLETALAVLGSLEPMSGVEDNYPHSGFGETLRLASQLAGEIFAHVQLLREVTADFMDDGAPQDGTGLGVNAQLLVHTPVHRGTPTSSQTDHDDRRRNRRNETPSNDNYLNSPGSSQKNVDSKHIAPSSPPPGQSPPPEEQLAADEGSQPDKEEIMIRYVQDRVDALIPDNLTPLHIRTLVEIILTEPSGTHEKRENPAFVRMICGYAPVEDAILEILFGEALPHVGLQDVLMENAVRIDDEGDQAERLLARDQVVSLQLPLTALMSLAQYLIVHPQGQRIYAYVLHLVRTVHTLKWAIEWKSMTKNAKMAYTDAAFQRLRASQIKRINIQFAGAQRNKKMKSLRQAFRKWHQKVVTSRNHLRKMYNVFGVGVLLDPTWATTPEKADTKRSPTFGSTLNLLLHDLSHAFDTPPALDAEGFDFHEYRDHIQAMHLDILSQILNVFDLPHILTWVQEFVEEFSPSF
ncbi:hypothetical protein FPV67DRAFT_1450189 [Lyophyllum atratum]|nr:hypothetical protein FPV67DRAFT_1450189 [Lyophyllum atratum]